MTYNFRINKQQFTVNVPEVTPDVLTPEQIQAIVKKWHKFTSNYLARLEVQKEKNALQDNVEKLHALVEFGVSMMGLPEEQARVAALKMLQAKDPNFRTEPTTIFTFTLDDMLRTLKVEDSEEEEE